MKLAVVSHSCVVDANQRVFREMERRGHNVAIITPGHWKHEYQTGKVTASRLDGLQGELISLPIARAGSPPLHGYRGRISRVVRRLRPDVLYVQEESYSVAALQWATAAWRARVPAVFYSAQNLAKRYPAPIRLSERYVWRRTRAACCVSPSVVAALRTRGYSGDAHVVPLSVDTSVFRPQVRDVDLVTHIGLREHVIGFLGRLVPEKGIHVLLAAYAILPESVRNKTTLLLLGEGPLAAACRAVDGVVTLPLAHRDVQHYLALVDILAVPSLTTPSWREQFGRAVIEAMACGIPVVGSDSGEIPTILENGHSGVVVAEGDALELANALRSLLQDAGARQRLGAAGRDRSVAQYSTESAAAQLERVLQLAA